MSRGKQFIKINFLQYEHLQHFTDVLCGDGTTNRSTFSILPMVRKILAHPIAFEYQEESERWWNDFCTQKDFNDPEQSSKIMLVFEILSKCCAANEKLVVFVDSLASMYAIQYFLTLFNKNPGTMFSGMAGQWEYGQDYFLLFGYTDIDTREVSINKFNDVNNKRARY